MFDWAKKVSPESAGLDIGSEGPACQVEGFPSLGRMPQVGHVDLSFAPTFQQVTYEGALQDAFR
ncbi:hypothetical protein AB0O34_27840 [Sphaerisporangium sp. NPDC088356]|uniref:hypothetical protein n=1 Tax=Sphaerisporangium sp. NPDC088356 TaxID=3154871 RepID=UPI003445131C